MKKSFIFPLLAILLVFWSSVFAEDFTVIVPGKGIGSFQLGANRATIEMQLGKPDYEDKKTKQWTWKEHQVGVFYGENAKAIQIHKSLFTHHPSETAHIILRFPKGDVSYSDRTTKSEIQKQFPEAEELLDSGEGWAAALLLRKEGITFEFTSQDDLGGAKLVGVSITKKDDEATQHSTSALAQNSIIACTNTQDHTAIEITGNASILSAKGLQTAKLKGLKKPVTVETDFVSDKRRLQLTITSVNGNKTILQEVKDADDVADAWDGAGTLAYSMDQAMADYKKGFRNGSKDERIFIIQQLTKGRIYPMPGGFCRLKSLI